MAEQSSQRRLAAIMVADVVGYSRMMAAYEAGTLAVLKDRRKAIVEPIIKARMSTAQPFINGWRLAGLLDQTA